MNQRKHLRRLPKIFDTSHAAVVFLTVCVRHRLPVLADSAVRDALVSAWQECLRVHGWATGRYVVMPDHVHFFAAPWAQTASDLSRFVGGWKQWTGREIRGLYLASFAWQREFFDHFLRSSESYAEKWEYVRFNPVRAGLCEEPEAWPYQGEVYVLAW